MLSVVPLGGCLLNFSFPAGAVRFTKSSSPVDHFMSRILKLQWMSGWLLVLAAMFVGCNAAKDAGDADPGSVAVAPESFDETLFSAATVKRDGQGSVISFQLRDQSAPPSLAALGQLRKLRSVVLSGSAITDEDLLALGTVTTLESLDLRGCPISDEGVKGLAGLRKLKSLKLSGKDGKTTVTDAGVASLGKASGLKVIALDFLPISDQGIESLSGCAELKELYLAHTDVSDAVATCLAGFTNLQKLRLSGTGFTSDGVAELSALKQLTELDVSECQGVDNQAISALAESPKLAKLNLYASGVADGPWQMLAGLESLTWLNIDKTELTDASIPSLAKLTSLTFLHIGSTQVTNDGIQGLQTLSHLKTLIVTRTNVDQAGVDALQPALQGTEIQWIYQPPK